MLGGELDDPKLTLTTVTDVTVSNDLRNVKVYVTNDDNEVGRQELLAALRRATPFLRGEIASRCGLRAVPELLFYYDSAPQRAARIDELLRKIAEERGETEPTSAAAPNATSHDEPARGQDDDTV